MPLQNFSGDIKGHTKTGGISYFLTNTRKKFGHWTNFSSEEECVALGMPFNIILGKLATMYTITPHMAWYWVMLLILYIYIYFE